METTSTLFLLLVLLFSVSGVRATVENSEIQDDFEENNHRVDAEQEPFTKVTLAAKSGDAVSTLFRSCLDSSQTFDAKFASIETPGGITYTRYVPDSSMLAIPMGWENAVGSVSDIFECAYVAEAGAYIMFKYSANGCKLARQGYNLEIVPECEDNEVDAVFIKQPDTDTGTSPSTTTQDPTPSQTPDPGGCVSPSVSVGPALMCLIFTDTLMTQDAAAIFCSSHQMVLYLEFFRKDKLSFGDVVAKIQQLGYTRNMWVALVYDNMPGSVWGGGFSPEDWANGAPPNDGSVAAYMDSQGGWKLTGGQKSDQAGAVCIVDP